MLVKYSLKTVTKLGLLIFSDKTFILELTVYNVGFIWPREWKRVLLPRWSFRWKPSDGKFLLLGHLVVLCMLRQLHGHTEVTENFQYFRLPVGHFVKIDDQRWCLRYYASNVSFSLSFVLYILSRQCWYLQTCTKRNIYVILVHRHICCFTRVVPYWGPFIKTNDKTYNIWWTTTLSKTNFCETYDQLLRFVS